VSVAIHAQMCLAIAPVYTPFYVALCDAVCVAVYVAVCVATYVAACVAVCVSVCAGEWKGALLIHAEVCVAIVQMSPAVCVGL